MTHQSEILISSSAHATCHATGPCHRSMPQVHATGPCHNICLHMLSACTHIHTCDSFHGIVKEQVPIWQLQVLEFKSCVHGTVFPTALTPPTGEGSTAPPGTMPWRTSPCDDPLPYSTIPWPTPPGPPPVMTLYHIVPSHSYSGREHHTSRTSPCDNPLPSHSYHTCQHLQNLPLHDHTRQHQGLQTMALPQCPQGLHGGGGASREVEGVEMGHLSERRKIVCLRVLQTQLLQKRSTWGCG